MSLRRYAHSTKKAHWSVHVLGRWIGFKVGVSRLAQYRQIQVWCGFVWVERSPWVFWQ